MENKIQKYGVAAKITAESYIKSNGILQVKEEEFEKKLKEESGNQRNRFEGYKENNRSRKWHQAGGEVKEIGLQEEDKMETLTQIKEETSLKIIKRDIF